MKTVAKLMALMAALVATGETAYAKRGWIMFGSQESLHEVTPVALKGPQGESLFLAYKTTTCWLIIAGVYVRDDGYVLALSGEPDRYYPLPNNCALLQRKGLLPSPLPAYKLSFAQYLFGYSLWWILGLAAVFKGGGVILRILRSTRAPNPLLEPVSDGLVERTSIPNSKRQR